MNAPTHSTSTLSATVENPHDPDGGSQPHWASFEASDDAAAI